MSQRPESLDLPYAPPSSPPNVDAGKPAPARSRGRWWSPFIVVLASALTFLVASGVMVVVAFYAVHGKFDPRMMTSDEGMMTVSSSRLGLLLLVAAPQLALVVPSLLAAVLSPEGITRRLSLVRGHWPIWAWCAAAVVTPLVGWISSVVVGAFMTESENLQMMSDVFRAHGESGFLVPLALLIGLTPALCEELLFRGYVQTRLNHSFGPFAAILVSSLMFAGFHMDPVHVVAVFPLGVFLGLVCWRSGSLLPAMLGHFVNNTVSVVMVVLSPASDADAISPTMSNFLTLILAVGVSGFVLTVYAWQKYPRPSEGAEPSSGGISNEPEIGPPADGAVAV